MSDQDFSESDLREQIRNGHQFERAVHEIAEHFYDEKYKDKRIPEIRKQIEGQVQELVPSSHKSNVASLAGRLIGDLVQEAKQRASPQAPDPLSVGEGPLPEERYDELPSPLYDLLQQIDAETEPFRRVHRLIDAIEWAVKWHTVLALSDLLNKQPDEETKILLAYGLRTPSLGLWNRFFQKAVDDLENPTVPWEIWERLTRIEGKHNLVAFRNKYGHGATPIDSECEKDVQDYLPQLRKLIHTPLFTKIGLLIKGQGADPVLVRGNESSVIAEVNLPNRNAAALLPDLEEKKLGAKSWAERPLLDLWPLALTAPASAGISSTTERTYTDASEKDVAFFYFNALKNEAVERLNYEIPLRDREGSLYTPFLEELPLQEWREVRSPDRHLARSRAEALTEDFVGRREERQHILDFATGGEGTLLVYGAPGVGKSALLAQALREIKAGIDLDGNELTGFNEQPVDPPPVIEYFARRGQEDTPTRFLRYLCQRLDDRYGLSGHGLGGEIVELQEQLDSRLQAVAASPSEEDASPGRTLLMIDGLDERPELRKFIPEARPWLPVIVSTRETQEAREFYENCAREIRDKIEVGPLSTAAVRAMLYKVINKYDPNLTDDYIEQIINRSGGNPLYLKLLCEKLFHGELEVGDSVALPEKIGELYRSSVQRVTNGGRDELARKVLLILAVTKAPLTEAGIAGLIDESKMRVQGARSTIMELLARRESSKEGQSYTESAPRYQLFHDTLREWLSKEYPIGCREMREKVAQRCFNWHNRDESGARNYALQHAAIHLKEIDDTERLWRLLTDESYRTTQVSETRKYDATYSAIHRGLETFSNQNGETPEDDARLCELALIAGEISQEAQKNVQKAFDSAEEGEMEKALSQIDVLDEQMFFLASVRLIWIEADRMAQRDADERRLRKAQMVLDAIEHRLAAEAKAVNWEDFISEDFMSWWSIHVLNILPDLEVEVAYSLTKNIDTVSNSLLKYIKEGLDQINESEAEFAYNVLSSIENNSLLTKRLSNLSKILYKKGKTKLSKEMRSESIEVAESMPEGARKDEAYSYVASSYASEGLVKKALSIIHSTDPHPQPTERPFSLADAASSFAQNGYYKEAVNLAFWIDSSSRRDEALLAVAPEISQNVSNKEAKRLIRRINNDIKRSEALVEIGKYEEALRIINSFDSVLSSSKVRVRVRAATSLAEDRRFDEALEVAESIKADKERVKTRAKIGLLLADHTQKPDIRIGALINRYDNNYDAENILEKSYKYIEKIEETNASDSRSIDFLIETSAIFYEAEEFDYASYTIQKAYDIAQSAQPDGKLAKMLTAVVNGFVQIGRTERAGSVFAEAFDVHQSSGNNLLRVKAAVDVGVAFSESQDGYDEVYDKMTKEAFELAQSFDSPKRRDDALGYIARALLEIEHFQEALDIASSLELVSEKIDLITDIALKHAQMGQTEQGIDLLQDSLELSKSEDLGETLKCNQQVEALTKVAEAYNVLMQPDRATEVLEEASELARGDARALATVAASLTQVGNTETAEATFQEAFETASSVDTTSLEAQVWSDFGLTTPNRDKAELLSYVSISLAESGFPEKALEVSESIDPSSESPSSVGAPPNTQDSTAAHHASALVDVSCAFAEAGRPKKALRISSSVKPKDKRAEALASVSIASDEMKNSQMEATAMDDALNLLNRSIPPHTREDVVRKVIERQTDPNRLIALANHLADVELSSEGWEAILPIWRDQLLEECNTHLLSVIRESLTLHPFSVTSSTGGVWSLIRGHAQAEQTFFIKAIAKVFPRLDLYSSDPQSTDPNINPEELPSHLEEQYRNYKNRYEEGDLSTEEFQTKIEVLLDVTGDE